MGKTKRNYWNILWIIVGIVFIVYSTKVGDLSSGHYVHYEYYGGDAYTGIQQAGADAASNVATLIYVLKDCFKYLFLTFGIAFIALGITKVMDVKTVECTANVVMPKVEAAPTVKTAEVPEETVASSDEVHMQE